MILRQSSYEGLAKTIRERNARILIYGAGMIGRIVMPYVVEAYGLQDYLDCYIDADPRKTGNKVPIGFREYEIRQPEYLKTMGKNTLLLVTNSKFAPILEYLDKLPELKETECYIIPVMQQAERRPRIPKTIHYCWFGGRALPAFLQECVESWRRVCPDYEILLWDETNYDVLRFEYTRQAYEKGKFGFVTDLARLDILYRHGGIYMDTDVRLLRPFGEMLYQKGFVGVERWGNINSGGGIGALPHHPMLREMLDYRLRFPFVYADGSLNLETNGLYETVPFLRHGMRPDNTLQIINGMTVYPSSVFHPYDYMSGEERKTDDTVSIHYFHGGWMEEEDRQDRESSREQYRLLIKRMERIHGDEE